MRLSDSSPPLVVIARVAAAALGAYVIGKSAVVTLGTALVALLGVVGYRWLRRRRGAPLTLFRSWLVAVATPAVVVAVALAVIFARAPRGELARSMQASRAQQARTPPPEWLTRISPQSAEASREQSQAAQKLLASRPATVYLAAMGTAMAALMVGFAAGTIGWAAALLMGFGLTGRWPARAPRRVLPGDERLAGAGAA